jgi:hypothetical protein
MIRALKILGDLSLANIDRAITVHQPNISNILSFIDCHADSVNYEDLYSIKDLPTKPKKSITQNHR